MAAEQPVLFVAGLSHKTAPVALREKLSPAAERVPELLKHIVGTSVGETVRDQDVSRA